jgi:cobalt/nickel transport system permease protein
MPHVIHIHLPVWQLFLLPAGAAAALALALAALRRGLRRAAAPHEDPDWSVPPLAEAGGPAWSRRWDVRCKILTLLAHSFAVASLEHLAPALSALGLSLLLLAAVRAAPAKVLMRLLAISGFVGMLLLVLPFSAAVREADTVVVVNGIDGLAFNLRGLRLGGVIAAKAGAIALLMEPLLATSPLPVTLHGLSRLGVPEMAGQMVLLSHRYLHVFRQEAQRMAAGMRVRGFRPRTDLETLRAVSNFLGMLFVRSFERTERVFEAMQARGYRGRFPEPVRLRLRAADLILAGVWLAAAAALVAWDRF